MTFISHAQNREDVLLWRALKHVKKGFYVDVGANHPSHDSVTKAFYDRGWSGINIEPLQSHFEELQRVRLRDVNLQLAAGAEEGEIDLYDSDVRGLATASLEVAQARSAAGGVVKPCRVPVRRLDGILEMHASDEQIHFLKIDVEGFESQVLQGMDFGRWRPWVVVIEATKPNSRELELGWEPLLTSANYQCVWFDGLNRYYLAVERMALLEHFQSPPNVFDEFVPAEQERLRLALEKTQNELSAHAYQNQPMHDVLAEVERLQSQLEAVFNSRSWQLTRPLRLIIKVLKALKKKVTQATLDQAQVAALAATGPAHLHPQLPIAKLTDTSFTYWHEASYPREAHAPVLLPKSSLDVTLWWRLTGHIEGHYSLAEVNRSLALELDSLSQRQLQFVPWHGTQYMPDLDQLAHETPNLLGMVQRVVPKDARVISLVHHYPPLQDLEAADLRLTLFFWEESQVPQDIVALLNASVDAVLVASQFVRRALRYSGCDRPIFVIPMGVQTLKVDAALRAQSRQGHVFRYLHVSSAFERKGVDVLLEAYGAAFTGADAVELYIKTFANPHHDIERQVNVWRTKFTHPPVVITDLSVLDESEMDGLYQSADAMVLPSRGEGFGLPAARALAMGTPLITTAGGGQADFSSLQFADLVPYHCANSRSHVNLDGAYWLEPQIQALTHQLIAVREALLRQDVQAQERRAAASKWLGAHYSWRQSAVHVDAVARQLLGAPSVPARRPQLSLFTPWRTTCGIAEYAHALFDGWDDAFDLKVYCDERTTPSLTQQLYTPTWKIGDQDSILRVLGELCEEAKAGHLDVLFVQHQQSLFVLSDEVCRALSQLRQWGVQVILELHSTLPMVREGRLGRHAARALRDIDLIVVHKIDDVNYMLGLGLSHNVMHLPLSVAALDVKLPEPVRQEFDLADSDWVLGCFGILWPHKGVDAVIQSMPLIAQASGKRVKLLAVTAVIDEASQQMLQTCRNLADALGVSADIIWVTDFLPIQDAMRILSMANMQLFVYGPTRESASGAVTIGLATHKPVWVSPEDIFSDLGSCTFALKGISAEDVALGVLTQMQTRHQDSAVYVAQQAWLKSRSWGHASHRLQAVIRGLAIDRVYPQSFDIAQDQGIRKLFVDVTQISLHDSGTGIQRVVRNIVRQWMSHPPEGYEVYPVCFDEIHGQYRHEQLTQASDPHIRARKGDIFVGLDLTAHLFPQVETLLAQWRMAGMRVCYVVYDIIPLTYPNLAFPGTPQAFDGWLRSLRRQADRVICISRSVADELRLWWCAHTEEGSLPEISSFHLGADLESDTLLPNELAHPVDLKINPENAVLMVGTLEPRKGYQLALDAFETHWAQGGDTSLIIAGKQGWEVNALCERIKTHPQLGRHLFWFDALNDSDLRDLYGRCKGLLMASQAEGFGLPLMEAAQYDLPILARDIPVFRELCGTHASYFSTQDAQALARSLQTWLNDIALGVVPRSSGIERLSWQTSAQKLLQEVL